MSEKENIENHSENNNEENDIPKKNVALIVVEAVAAVTALGFIGFALFSSNKDDSKEVISQNQVTTSDNVSANEVETPITEDIFNPNETVAEIDNSAYYILPAIPEIGPLNEFSESECEEKLNDKSVIKIESDGYYVYVANIDNIAAIKKATKYSEDDVEDMIFTDLLSYNLVDAPADKTVCELHDKVNIDYAGYLDGVAFDGGTAEGFDLTLGSGQFIPGFEDQVVGMKVGETRDINVTFPEEYGAEELAGKETVFTVKLNSIVSVPSELTDEIVQASFKDITTVDECYDYYRDVIIKNKIYEYITSCYYVSAVDPKVVENNYNMTIDYYANMCSSYYQIGIDKMLEISETTADEFKDEIIKSSAQSAMSTALYAAIADNYELEVDDEALGKLAILYGYADENGVPNIEGLYSAYGEQAVNDYLTSELVVNYILDKIN